MRVKLISGQFCSRCHMISPLLKKWCEDNWHTYLEKDIQNVTPEEIEWASMLPVIRMDDKQVDYDEALAMIS